MCANPKYFTWDELVKMLAAYEFEELTKSKTASSRRQFYNSATQVTISLHKPHPSNTFTGSFNVRLGPELHRKAALASTGRGSSLNQLVSQAVSQFVAQAE